MKKINAPEKVIFICDGKKCCRYSNDIRKGFKELIKENGLKKQIELQYTDCTGNCKHAPVICLQPENIWLGEVEPKNIKSIFKEHFL
ncbi:(2Fe-2S) ferredoxin domain-containing protein [Flavobacterium sp. Sd200]|uniref:(2Fe-2S) ferredoxin domain-containing protein n=1 Tax=Flavobacterium sp. Sd200 TaxID=2692211 RepID=UPI001371EC30|nr:(2Fe-2S) ferredoxin domain-containing protein [Flavobacterium sp. Sd200]MXN90689.1 (2Fe-2S) ferredoxin domain-containing protein [Flavobacterium sp. Sd200]